MTQQDLNSQVFDAATAWLRAQKTVDQALRIRALLALAAQLVEKDAAPLTSTDFEEFRDDDKVRDTAMVLYLGALGAMKTGIDADLGGPVQSGVLLQL